jgi:hypothetical protein
MVMIAAVAALLARSVGNLYAVDPSVRIEGVAVEPFAAGGGRCDHEPLRLKRDRGADVEG